MQISDSKCGMWVLSMCPPNDENCWRTDNCFKYMALNPSDSKIDSIYEFFLYSDIIDRESIARENGGCFIKEYFSHFDEYMSELNLWREYLENLSVLFF